MRKYNKKTVSEIQNPKLLLSFIYLLNSYVIRQVLLNNNFFGHIIIPFQYIIPFGQIDAG